MLDCYCNVLHILDANGGDNNVECSLKTAVLDSSLQEQCLQQTAPRSENILVLILDLNTSHLPPRLFFHLNTAKDLTILH